jgi:hypothetical protein
MGMAKRQLENGYISLGEKYVCRECINDYAIQDFIEGELEEDICSYCGKTSNSGPIAAKIDNIINFIIHGIQSEWDDPRNCMSWESKEGGWIGAEVLDIYDLLFYTIGLEIDNDELRDDIAQSILQDEWCKADPYGLTKQEEWYLDWEDFSNQVKYKVRYIFYKIKRIKRKYYEKDKEPHEILDQLGLLIKDLNLIRSIPKGSIIYRARAHKGNKRFSNVEDLGPPKDAKQPNRMSPAGIPMFYGSLDENTAITETRDIKKYITVAAWKTLKKLNLLDLTELPYIPSIFDQDRYYLRSSIIFLHSFLRDFSKPIEKDGREHIEYVPTQIVTEYFRHIFRDERGKKIQGIIFPSSLIPGSKSCVLFFHSEDCTECNLKVEGSHKPSLCLITSSIKRIKL